MVPVCKALVAVQALLVCLCVLLATPTFAQIPRQVIVLNQDNFEHHTQASTGQTAGIWFVLFNDKTHPRAGEVNALWMQLAMDEEKDFIVAEVFLDEMRSRALAWQFANLQPPSAVLFRDQMMYIYPRPLHQPGALQSLQKFCAEGYLEVTPEIVPGSIHGRQTVYEAQEDWVREQKESSRFNWKTAVFGLVCMYVGYRLKTWAAKKKLAELIAEKQKQEKEAVAELAGGQSSSSKGQDSNAGKKKN